MPIRVNSKFRFSQYYVQDDGGWCGGISHAIITHLYENLGAGLHVDPVGACGQTQQYVSLLQGTFNKITGQAASWASPIRRSVRTLQRAFDLGGVGKPPGTYEYSFNQAGTALLSLVVREPASSDYGSDFLGSWSMDSVTNHAGVAIWDTNGCIFLFDPNCGGIMVHWTPCSVVTSFAVAVDMALRSGYGTFDRMKGGRSAKLVSALKLDPAALPYGNV